MREIKFRAWDNINNRIVSVESIDFASHQLHFLSEPFKGNPTFIIEYVLMQYTGLKDKNGVEIYEGDICRKVVDNYTLREYEGLKLGEFKYYKVEFGCSGMGDTYGFQLNSIHPYPWNARQFIHHVYSDIEVIGNIYEHSHLFG